MKTVPPHKHDHFFQKTAPHPPHILTRVLKSNQEDCISKHSIYSYKFTLPTTSQTPVSIDPQLRHFQP